MAARFDAFISYSRAASSTLAVELRNGIERFAKPWYRLRSSRVFLDDASMSANTGLWSTIERGLTEAEWFILLCSPKSAASQYVTNEIAWWLEHKSADRMLLVLDEGEIVWNARTRDFDRKRATAINPALSKAFAEEPRWVDLSWFEQPDSLGAADPRFPERVADLAAAVRGIERDELVGENVQQRRRALRLARGAIIALSALLVASLVATGIAVVNGNAAAEQARIAQARQLAAQAITLSSTDLQTASLLAVEALRLNDDAQTEAALFQLANASPYLVRSLPVGSPVRATAVVPDGTVLTGSEDGRVVRWAGSDADELFTLPGPVVSVAASDDQGVVVAATAESGAAVQIWVDGGVLDLDLTLTGADESSPATLVALSPDARFLAVSDRISWTTLLERVDGGYRLVGTAPHGGRLGFGDGEITTMTVDGSWARISTADAQVIAEGFHILGVASIGSAVSADGAVMAGSLGRGVNYSLWNTVGSISGGGTVDGDPPDRIATSAIAGALDLALDASGDRLATMTDGAIYVSDARDPAVLPDPPIALTGSGIANAETLAFAGDHLVSGSGDYALVWDLTQAGRITDEFTAPVPDPCTACGTQIVRTNDAGTRIVMTDVTGFSTVVSDLETGESDEVQLEGGASLTGAAWFGDDRIIVYDPDSSALLVLSGAAFSAVDLSVPITLGSDATALAIRSDGREDGRTTVLDDTGYVQTFDLGTGEVVAGSDDFADLLGGQVPAGADIAPDQSTAYVWIYGENARVVDIAKHDVVYEATGLDGIAYDAASAVHVFAKGTEWTVESSGEVATPRPADVVWPPAPVLSPDGRIVVSGGTTGVVSLIDLGARGQVFGRIPVPVQDRRFAISVFSPDGASLITAIQSMDTVGRPATVRRMDMTVPGWVASACAVAGRDLTPDEWLTYVGTTPPADLRCDR